MSSSNREIALDLAGLLLTLVIIASVVDGVCALEAVLVEGPAACSRLF